MNAGMNARTGEGLRVQAEVRLPAFTLRADFDVPPGLTVLFGPSGAGKSLALQAIAGLVPLGAGSLALGGRLLADTTKGIALPPRLRRVGYVPQHYALFPHLTVAENVAYALPASRHPWDRTGKARRAERVAELLALVRLAGFEQRWPRQLSGGQQQRVALARALAADPAALLLDEPLGALDAPTRAAVQDDLRAVVLASGVPAVVVTHDLAEARVLADRLVVVIDGRVVAQGPLAEVLAAPPTAEAALLLGWRNVLPLAAIAPASEVSPTSAISGKNGNTGRQRVDLACGQSLSLVCAPSLHWEGRQEVRDLSLALHADRIEVLPAGAPPNRGGDTCLTGTLRSVGDGGAYYLLRVALDGAAPESSVLAITCSPREWAALGLTPGGRVALQVPEGAARLVAPASGGDA